MESEKVKEIKKALASSFCIDIDYVVNIDGEPTMKRLWIGSVINLINELESENDRLKWEKQTLEDKDTLLAKVGEMVQENQQVKGRIAELEFEVEHYKERLVEFEKYHKETLQDFAERLKDSGEIKALLEMETMPKVFKHIHDEIVKSIDKKLKEFLK